MTTCAHFIWAALIKKYYCLCGINSERLFTMVWGDSCQERYTAYLLLCEDSLLVCIWFLCSAMETEHHGFSYYKCLFYEVSNPMIA